MCTLNRHLKGVVMTLSPYLAILFMSHFGRIAPRYGDILAVNRHNGGSGLGVLVLVKEVCGNTTNTAIVTATYISVRLDTHVYSWTHKCTMLDTYIYNWTGKVRYIELQKVKK